MDANDETHHCHWPGCKKPVPPRLWGCKTHWFQLPEPIRDAIWAAYRPGQENDKRPSRSYLIAASAAHQFALAAEREKTPLLS